MEKDLDVSFVPPRFILIPFMVICGLLTIIVVYDFVRGYFAVMVNAFVSNIKDNVDRVGMIFQVIGLLSVLPDLWKPKTLKNWELKFSTWGKRVSFTYKNMPVYKMIFRISESLIVDDSGVIGLVNQISRLLGFLSVVIALLLYRSYFLRNEIIYLYYLFFACCIWIALELWNRKHKNKEGYLLLKMARGFCWFFAGGIFFFLPLLLIIWPCSKFLVWASKNALQTVLARVTLPFILTGMIFQLWASFL